MLARIRIVLLCVGLGAGLLTAAATSASALAATVDGVSGGLNTAVQARDGSITVTGWAFRTGDPTRSMWVCIWTNHVCQAKVQTRVARPDVNNHFHITGVHGFQAVLPRSALGSWVVLHDWPPGSPTITMLPVSTPGARIIAVAKRYVGKSPYRSGGATPAGFDCSGFTLYSYEQGHVSYLPHSSESQRHVAYMHAISKASARPGDLVFYLSGGRAYHVAVYAGNGMQYAATVPGEKIRYQGVWSSAVEYRTNWH